MAGRARKTAEPVTALSRIGNLGCIRFPKPLRSASGIKRGCHLVVDVVGAGTIRLEKIEVGAGGALPEGLAETLAVKTCACESPSESCRDRPSPIVTVGWSYVQLDAALATELGFEPDTPIKLVAEPSAITVELYEDSDAWDEIPSVACPP